MPTPLQRPLTLFSSFMAQMTLARFRGDTAFELVARLLSTLGGCVTGLAMWCVLSSFEMFRANY